MTPSIKALVSWLLVLATLITSSSQQAFAWGSTGHEAVAYIAWDQMSGRARSESLKLLKLVPQLTTPTGKLVAGYAQWVQQLPSGLSPDEQKRFLFMRAATWADSIKHVGFSDSDDPPNGVSVDHPKGFKDSASHGYWHFIDKGLTADESTVLDTPVPNIAVQLDELRNHLASDRSKKDRAYELVWIEHLVGDIHQPLHGARRFVQGESDLGGNSVKISLPEQLVNAFLANRPAGASGAAPAKLHAFWDDLPGVTGDPALALRPAAEFANQLSKAEPGDVDPTGWAGKSFDLAVQHGYVSPIGPGNSAPDGTAFAMTKEYYDAALADAKGQIALAGARLAKILNDRWPEK
jgi:hypothetical protein